MPGVPGVWKHLGDDGPEGEPPDDCERCGDEEPAYVCEFANLPDGTEWIYYCEECTDWAKGAFAPESVEPL